MLVPLLAALIGLAALLWPGDPADALWDGYLDRLSRLARQEAPPAAALPDLETLLAALAHSSAGGDILRQTARARVELERATAVLRGLEGDRLCPRGRASQRAHRLRNLLDGYYGERVQAFLAELDRRHRALGQALDALHGVTGGTPALDAWLDRYFGDGGQVARLNRALKAHTGRWRDLMGACGLMPGGAGTGTDTY
ncbi:DUF3080 family protein [Alcanivorax sp. MM125-6]|nr:DUF3080 family protein [Alcanivorax sp. MM125-6]